MPFEFLPIPDDILKAQSNPMGFANQVGGEYYFTHPYKQEVEQLEKPSFTDLLNDLESQKFIYRQKKNKLEFVNSKEGLERANKELNKAKIIAIDLEYHSEYSFQGFTCLMQVW